MTILFRAGRLLLSDRLVVTLVVLSAAFGLLLRDRLQPLLDAGAVDAVLFVLVLAAALTLPMAEVRAIRSSAARLSVVAIGTAVTLPVVAWGVAHLVPDSPSRLGVLALGVAPAEIATVAFAAAAGAGAAAGTLLVASTLLTVVAAAPVLTVLAGSTAIRTGELIVTLVAVVIVPAAIGLVAGPRAGPIRERAAPVATGAVVVLVGLTATQVQVDADLGRVAAALLAFLGIGVVVGRVAALLTAPEQRAAVVLSVSMRDFAVASGIAVAAFGPAAAAPLGLYGILVMVWGAVFSARVVPPTAPGGSTPRGSP